MFQIISVHMIKLLCDNHIHVSPGLLDVWYNMYYMVNMGDREEGKL